jgi:hypothetical protein
MKKTLFLIIAFLICHSNYLLAQKSCGSELDVEELQKSDPKRYERIMQFNKLVEEYSSNTKSNERIIDPNGTIIIPVVFHLLYDGGQPPLFLNPTDARVQTQIDILNEDFGRTNPDKVNTPLPFQGIAADVNIKFKLACIDPNGNPTTGITRRDVGTRVFREINYPNGARNELATGIKFTSQGGQDAWATDKYLNIWVVSRMETFDDDK